MVLNEILYVKNEADAFSLKYTCNAKRGRAWIYQLKFLNIIIVIVVLEIGGAIGYSAMMLVL